MKFKVSLLIMVISLLWLSVAIKAYNLGQEDTMRRAYETWKKESKACW